MNPLHNLVTVLAAGALGGACVTHAEDTELTLHGVAVRAHVKALPQVRGPSE